MAYDRKDHYWRMAKKEGKASRAAYKLEELVNRFHLVKKGATVVDLGSAPGGWLEELSQMVGPKGKVIGIDILPLKIHTPKYCFFIKGDITDDLVRNELIKIVGAQADVVFSDMSPNLSGVAFADAYRSYELSLLALEAATKLLKHGGSFVVKIFPGDEFNDLVLSLKKMFSDVNVVVPKATRKTSSERYIVATRYKKPPP